MAPQVLEYNEHEGRGVGPGQELVESSGSKTSNWVQLPWRGGPKEVGGNTMDKEEAEMASVLSVLRALYFHHVVADEPIDVLLDEETGEKKVVVLKDIEKEQLRLPPCIPKTMRVLKHSTNPQRVQITVQMYQKGDGAAVAAQTNSRLKRKLLPEYPEAFTPGEYYVHPEAQFPKDVTTSEQRLNTPTVRSWEYQGTESMQPFWLVRRLTEAGLKSYTSQNKAAKFNTKLIQE